jgi:transposase
MDYFAGLDISMDETHVCVLDREGVVVRESKTESAAAAIAGELAKAPTCRRIVFETGRMAPILFYGLNQLGLPVVCVESRQAYQALKSLPPTRPIATTREGWRIWPALASSSPCM